MNFCCCNDPCNPCNQACNITSSGCGAPCGVSCVQTETQNNTVGVAQNNAAGGNNRNTSSLFNNLSLLGLTIASAATSRPVINQNGVNTLGPKPLVTGQVTAQNILVVVGIGLVGFLVWTSMRGSK